MSRPLLCAVWIALLAPLVAHCGDDDGTPDVLTFEPFEVDGGMAPTSMGEADKQGLEMQPMDDVMGVASESNSGIGTACDTDADCAEGQYCHMDFENYTMHRQCTARCNASEACQAEFGEGTFCIGAEVCVAACATDDDCGESTVCADLGSWCSRQGPASGNPYCAGTPTSCSALIGGLQCIQQLGCTDTSDCTGSATSCYSLFSSYTCNSQDGCSWDYDRSECSGVSRSCGSMSEFSCNGQDGCRWRSGCIGSPLDSDCEDISVSLCEFTEGCFVIDP